MSHNDWIQLFAYITLIGTALNVLIDAAVEFGVYIALRVWGSLFYLAVRYITISSALVLALDVIIN